MADAKQAGWVMGNALINSFKKLNSSLDIQLVQESVNSLGAGKISQLLFESTYGTAKPIKGARPQTAKPAKLTKTVNDSVLRKLENAIVKEGLTLDQAFKKCDANGDGFVILPEFKIYIANMLNGTTITGADIMTCMKTLDTNKDGKISKEEFSALFKDAKENVDADGFGEEDDIGGD